MSTPSTHESIMDGLFAGHEAVQLEAKKRICCLEEQGKQKEAAELWLAMLRQILEELVF